MAKCPGGTEGCGEDPGAHGGSGGPGQRHQREPGRDRDDERDLVKATPQPRPGHARKMHGRTPSVVQRRKSRRSRHAYASPSLIEPSLATMDQRQVISARVVHPRAPAVRRSCHLARRDGAAGWTGGSRVVQMERVR
jgi:hypothetical protein